VKHILLKLLARRMAPNRNSENLISMSYSQENLREPILLHVFHWEPFFLASNSQLKMVPLGSPGNNC
jgi:hypothetical protein